MQTISNKRTQKRCVMLLLAVIKLLIVFDKTAFITVSPCHISHCMFHTILLAEKGHEMKPSFQLHATNVAINQDSAASPNSSRPKSVSKFHSERGQRRSYRISFKEICYINKAWALLRKKYRYNSLSCTEKIW